MTREEALKAIEYVKERAEVVREQERLEYRKQEINWTIEAMIMAIEALKRESFENDTKIKSCSKDSDLISRAEVIEALGEEPPVWCDEEYEIAERNQWRADIEAIKSVPSAEARPTGEWIPLVMNGEYKCSVCGRASKSDNAAWVNIPSAYWNYCPNCGADMRGDTK